MKTVRVKKWWLCAMAALCALIVFSAACPAVCQAMATQAATASPHDCCPADVPASQPVAPPHTVCHCDHPALALMSDFTARAPAQDWHVFAVATTLHHRASHVAHPLQIAHAPPHVHSVPSLYLQNNSLLI